GTFLAAEGPVAVKAGQLVTAKAGSQRGFRAETERLVVLVLAVLPPAA
ncbi:MAG: hypothetical protein IT373_28205, partial [Polyangiaceae bacterium]|nr:hypothetical protein [Polyangiaceae bacterium]